MIATETQYLGSEIDEDIIKIIMLFTYRIG